MSGGLRFGDWARRYPPLAVIVGALLLAVFTLPSALNLPQSNPGQTLEYAPVPGDQGQTNPGGNLAGLGLGSSDTGSGSGVGGGAGVGGPPPPPPPAPTGSDIHQTGKACVGSPPRQTEDPLSPPCAAYFQGDNGGATYQGVSKNEISIVLYVTGAQYQDVGSQGVINHPIGTCFDASSPAQRGEDYYVEAGRIWQAYFNSRYQTYNRVARVHVCFASTPDGTSNTAESPETRKQDAANELATYKPFAEIADDYYGGYISDYINAMAAHGVMSFGSEQERPNSAFSAFPQLIWSYDPSVEEHAASFSSYVCQKVVPFTTSFGDPAQRGKPRRLGLLHTSASFLPEQQLFAKLVKQQVSQCGGNFVDDQTFDFGGGLNYGFDPSGDASYRQKIVASFVKNNVTTVIWAESLENGISPVAHAANYFPEWVIAGDGRLEDLAASKTQDSAEWANAWTVTEQTLQHGFSRQQCVLAGQEADPQLPVTDREIPCRLYNFFRQLFDGIQVAGPHLTPSSVDAGFHAIPGHPSSSPDVPACFYRTGEYTCIKDAIPMWWDSNATSPYSSQKGCYRVPESGRRYLAGAWPSGDVPAQRNAADDTCTSYVSGRFTDSSPGPESPTPQ